MKMQTMQDNDHISQSVRQAMERYFQDLDGETPAAIYDMVLACVEKPLLEVVLIHTQGNQTRAAELLGAVRVVIMMSGVPVVGTLLAVSFLGETLTPGTALGVAITFLGALIGAMARPVPMLSVE